MTIKFFTHEKFHNRYNTGSTRLRVHNLLKYWPEASLYKFGEQMDVMIFQKVYVTYDYKYPIHLNKIKILDVCDLDWYATPDIHIKETIDAMDAITCPTLEMKRLISTMTDKPVYVIKDRFDIKALPDRKQHKGTLKTAVWFGYRHNSELMKYAISALEKRGIKLIVVSNDDPMLFRYANDSVAFETNLYEYVKFDDDTYMEELQKADVCILPDGYRPEDRYKSENRTIQAQLLGLPVVKTADDLDKLMLAQQRNETINGIYDTIRKEYDCKKSVEEYKKIIQEIQNASR